MFRNTSGQLLRKHTRNPRHLDLHPHTRHREMFTRQDCCTRTPQAHLDLSPCARRPVHATTLLRSHAVSTLGSRHVLAKRLLRSHAANTLGSRSVRKEAVSGEKTLAFSRREHTWISLRTQRNMFHRKDCCVLTPGAQLDLSPCARRPVHATALLRSHAVRTLGSHSVRKETCSGERTAAFSRHEHTLGSRSVSKETCSIEKTAAISHCPPR